MKTLAFGALFVGLLAACGGGDNNKITIIDMNNVDALGVCNPLTQAGCATGEKCTWLLDALMPQYIGHVGCAPDGTAAAGEACMFGAPGASGYDNCKKGTVCGNYRGGAGTCKSVCDQQGGTPMCDNTHVCVTYSGLFSTGDTTPAAGGVCDLACDPLEDNDFDGAETALMKTKNTCGSAASVGCYGYPSYGTPPATGWSCTNDINSDAPAPGLRHRVKCTEANNCADPGPQIYVNSCNQGYLPLLYEASGSTDIICVALCKPDICYSGNCGTGTNPPSQRIGVAPHQCKAGQIVSVDSSVATTEHCQYMWWREVDDSGNFLMSPTSDSVGICFDMAKYYYDSNGDNKVDPNTDKKLPNCDLLGSGFGSGSDRTMPNSYFGAADLGCVSSDYVPAMANGKKALPAETMHKREMTNLPRALYRRTMGAN